jgi:hypothetical protein
MPKDFSFLFDTPLSEKIDPRKPSEPIPKPVPEPAPKPNKEPVKEPTAAKKVTKTPVDRLVLEAMNKRFARKVQSQDTDVKRLDKTGKLI